MNIIDLFSQNKLIQTWHRGVSNLGRQLIMGLSGASKALAIASAYQANEEKIVVLTSTQNEVEKLASDLSGLIGEDKVYTFLRMTLQQQNLFLRLWIKLTRDWKL